MKINFLNPCYVWAPSGGMKVVYEYANQLVARGHQVSVIHPRHLKFAPPEKLTLRSAASNTRWWLKEFFSRPDVDWHRMDPRVQLLYVPNSDPRYVPDADILFATAFHTVRSVLECPPSKGEKCYLIQGYETWLGPQNLVDNTWRAPLHKIVVSKWLLEIGKKLGCEDLSYIPNGVDLTHYRLITPLAKRPRQVAMAFSSTPIKAARDGIKALEIAKQQFPDLRAVLFGKERCFSFIPPWITYVRDASQNEIVEHIFNKSRIVLSSSLAEGFGLPPAEGAACGCAMVATDSGGVRDFIIPGETGLLSPPADPQALARNLCRLLENDSLRIQLANAGRAVVQRFTWDRSAGFLESFLNQAVNPEHAKSSPVPVALSPQLQVPRLEMNECNQKI